VRFYSLLCNSVNSIECCRVILLPEAPNHIVTDAINVAISLYRNLEQAVNAPSSFFSQFTGRLVVYSLVLWLCYGFSYVLRYILRIEHVWAFSYLLLGCVLWLCGNEIANVIISLSIEVDSEVGVY